MRLTSSTYRIRITHPKSIFLLPALALLACGTALAQTPTYKVGRPPTAEELHTWNNLVGPDGKELPVGSGSAAEGAPIFAAKCAMCHGKEGEGVYPFPRLVGGVGTLNTTNPNTCRMNYFPYAAALWDYINRAMPPFPLEKNLTPDNIYALTAFLLSKNGIIKETDVMDKNSLVKVQMPKGNGI
jgi:mono/diheme cytochrome c family protein